MNAVTPLVRRVRAASESHRELTRFLLVGASGTAVNYAILTLTYRFLGWPVVVAALLSNEVALVSNFFCHEHWTFAKREDRHGTRRVRFLRYQVVATGGVIITTAVLALLVHFGMHYAIANAIAIAIAVSWNFLMSHRWAWRRSPVELLE